MAKHVFESKKISVDIKLVAEREHGEKEPCYFTEMDGRMVMGTLSLNKESAEKKFNKLVEQYGEIKTI